MTAAVFADALRKHYREDHAVRILTTLLRPDGGRAEVDGVDVVRDPHRVRRRIGLVGQHAAVDEILDGRANLVMFGRLFPTGARSALRCATGWRRWPTHCEP